MVILYFYFIKTGITSINKCFTSYEDGKKEKNE